MTAPRQGPSAGPGTGSRCVTCGSPIARRPENSFFPFCGGRCKAVDLGRWLGGEYRLASRSRDEDDDGHPTADEVQ